MIISLAAGVRYGRTCTLVLAGLLGSCCAATPLEPPVDDRRGAAEREAGVDARALLLECLERADTELRSVEAYEAQLVKQERVDGRLCEAQRIACKVRHEPFAVYLHFLAPDAVAGQQALYAGARYEGKLIARSAGIGGLLGAMALDPEGALAMRDNRYPITDTGLERLLSKLRALVTEGDGFEQCLVLDGASIDGRRCTVFELLPRPGADFALARAFFDDAWGLPVAYEAFEQAQEGLRLLERYTYVSVRFDAVLGDDDFDRENPDYDLR